MKLSLSYYISRLIMALAFGALVILMGASWWFAGVTTLIMLVFTWFVYPKSDRFVVKPEEGLKAVQRDERQREVTAKAGRNGFIALNFLFLCLALYSKLTGINSVHIGLVAMGLGVGLAVYMISDLMLRG